MLLLFFPLIQCLSNIDDRKYIFESSTFNYSWEYGGYTRYDSKNQKIQLVDGDRYSEGFLWLLHRLPRSNWSIENVFEFSHDSNLNQFGVWITKNYGISGKVFGGPKSFFGLSILFKLYNSNLDIEIRQDNGSDLYNPIVFLPTSSIKLKQNQFKLYINYSNEEDLTIEIKECIDSHVNISHKDDINHVIFNGKTKLSLSHFWFGFTSYNPKDGKPLFINSVYIKGLKVKRENDYKILKNETKFNSSQLIETLNSNISYENVIRSIELLVNQSNKMLRQKLLSMTIQNQFVFYTDSWQRRSLIATKEVKQMQNFVNSELRLIENDCNSFHFIIVDTVNAFRQGLNKALKEFLIYFEEELKSRNRPDSPYNYQIPIVPILMSISIVEMLIFMICICISLCKIKHRSKKFTK